MLTTLFLVIRTWLNKDLMSTGLEPYEITWEVIKKPSSIIVMAIIIILAIGVTVFICLDEGDITEKIDSDGAVGPMAFGIGYLLLCGLGGFAAIESMVEESPGGAIVYICLLIIAIIVMLGLCLKKSYYDGGVDVETTIIGVGYFLFLDLALFLAGIVAVLALTIYITPIGILMAALGSDGKFK